MSTRGLATIDANNFMGLEPHLVQLVKDAVAGMSPAVHVLTASELADVKQSAQAVPAVHVIYGGYRVAEDLATAWRLEHTWFAVVAVRNVANTKSGQAARAAAGPLVALVMAALAGASVPGATKALTLVTPPPAGYIAGYQYVPSAFIAETIFRKP